MSTQRYTLQRSKTAQTVAPKGKAQAIPLARWVVGLSIAYCTLILAIWFLINVYSEDWWISAIFVYLPRLPYLVPAFLLLGACWFYCKKWMILNLATIAFILFPLMNYSFPLGHYFSEPVEGNSLRIVSCNVQRYKPDFSKVLQEIAWNKPDIIALQESPNKPPMVNQYFKDWYTVEFDEYWVGSKYPLKLISTCKTAAFDRISAIAVEVSLPDEKVMLFNVHQTTARVGMTELDLGSLITGQGQSFLENYIYLRSDESLATREFIEKVNPEYPRMIVGDFNAPFESSVYQNAWGDLQNCFKAAGWGYGYTSPVKKHRIWLDYTPWLKIDHILVGNHWTVNEATVGSSNGSDHRLVSAILVLKPSEKPSVSRNSSYPVEEGSTLTHNQ